jgi:hypothetical protein
MFSERRNASSESNDHTQESLPDEDPLEEAVNDPDILAEVTLPKTFGGFCKLS